MSRDNAGSMIFEKIDDSAAQFSIQDFHFVYYILAILIRTEIYQSF